MNASPASGRTATEVAADLAQLNGMVAHTRAVLEGLRRDVAEAEQMLGSAAAARLLEANEQLVEAALRSKSEADTAASALEELARASRQDPLTGMANRSQLQERLTRSLVLAKRRDDRLALLFLDLNDFKVVNDTLGHAVGDEVLKIAAERLFSCVRESDTVSRHGGDEFLVLLPEISDPGDAARVAEKMLAKLAAPCRIDGHVLRLTASIGISVYPDDGSDADELIRRADAAMYRAKAEGSGSFVFRGAGDEAERLVNLPSLASLRRPLTRHDAAESEHNRRLIELREANERLVLAAIAAQERQGTAEETQRRQRRFLATVAHELRNPLAPIRTAASAMGTLRHPELSLPKVQAIIERQVVHMARLVDDLLDVARIDTGKLRLDRALVDIADLVNAAVEASRPSMDTRMQSFHSEVPQATLQIGGDFGRLVQALTNVLNNASKYTPEGGAIVLRVDATESHVLLSVTDSGIGISSGSLTAIFEPFSQSAEAVTFNGAGLGIGLAVVRDVVEAHGGKVWAESPGPGSGSRFFISLPTAISVKETRASAGLPLAANDHEQGD